MNLKKIHILILAATLAIGSGCSAIRKMQGDYHYENLSFAGAIPFYEKVLEKKPNAEAAIRLAECYYRNNRMKQAESMYSRVVSLPEAGPDHKLYYAKALMQNGKYAEAKKWLGLYMDAKPGSKMASNLLIACDSIMDYKKDTMLWSVNILPEEINREGSNFSPAMYKGGIIFASERHHSTRAGDAEWTGNNYLDLFYTDQDSAGEWKEPTRLEGKINSIYHEGPLSFSADGNQVFFTRNDYLRGKRGKSDEYINNLKIYSANLVQGEWKDISELNFNSHEFSCGHPAIYPDGSRLFFASDRPGGFGGTDIWYSLKIGAGMWADPVNAGPVINTTGNEMFPYVSTDSVLYFSSDGLPGIGGLDIFTSRETESGWSVPVNMHCPVNSSRDDFGFIIDSENGKGFFSSNRNRPEGVDEIYGFSSVQQVFSLDGIVVNRVTQVPMRNSIVTLRDHHDNLIGKIKTGPDGEFHFPLVVNEKYEVLGNHDLCFPKTASLSTEGEKYSKKYFVKLELDTVPFNKPVVLRNIYYDYDKWDIRADAQPDLDLLVGFLKANPNVKVELSSHTDCRGSHRYNEKLSQKRAESAVNYIISKGIDPSRIVAKGYGETVLVNSCKDGATCTEEQHQDNRRTEFKVISR